LCDRSKRVSAIQDLRPETGRAQKGGRQRKNRKALLVAVAVERRTKKAVSGQFELGGTGGPRSLDGRLGAKPDHVIPLPPMLVEVAP
jgi:hypothetical protein